MSLGVSVADTPWTRLKGLLGRARLNSNDGLWVVPSHGVHTLGMLFPIDVVYLDSLNKVVHLIENFASFRIAPFKTSASSLVELPLQSIRSSQTQVGDQCLICTPEDIERYFTRQENAKQTNVLNMKSASSG